MDHGLGHIDALFIISHQTTPAGHPGEGAFAPQRRGSTLKLGSLSMRRTTSMTEPSNTALSVSLRKRYRRTGADLRPALADRVQDDLRTSAVGNIRRRQIDCEKPAVSSPAHSEFTMTLSGTMVLNMAHGQHAASKPPSAFALRGGGAFTFSARCEAAQTGAARAKSRFPIGSAPNELGVRGGGGVGSSPCSEPNEPRDEPNPRPEHGLVRLGNALSKSISGRSAEPRHTSGRLPR